MPTFDDAAADAHEVQTALRALAHATRAIDDPRQIYPVLGSLTSAVASLSQSMHQVAAFHDDRAKKSEWVPERSANARAASYRASWELHRAGEMLRQVGETIGHAHEAEAALAYHRDFAEPSFAPSHGTDRGIGL